MNISDGVAKLTEEVVALRTKKAELLKALNGLKSS